MRVIVHSYQNSPPIPDLRHFVFPCIRPVNPAGPVLFSMTAPAAQSPRRRTTMALPNFILYTAGLSFKLHICSFRRRSVEMGCHRGSMSEDPTATWTQIVSPIHVSLQAPSRARSVLSSVLATLPQRFSAVSTLPLVPITHFRPTGNRDGSNAPRSYWPPFCPGIGHTRSMCGILRKGGALSPMGSSTSGAVVASNPRAQ